MNTGGLRALSTRRVQSIIEQFNSSYGLPFQQLLPQETIEQFLAVEKIKYRQRLFTPIVTLWTFLSQVLAPDKTCHNAVSRVIAWLAWLREGNSIIRQRMLTVKRGSDYPKNF